MVKEGKSTTESDDNTIRLLVEVGRGSDAKRSFVSCVRWGKERGDGLDGQASEYLCEGGGVAFSKVNADQKVRKRGVAKA